MGKKKKNKSKNTDCKGNRKTKMFGSLAWVPGTKPVVTAEVRWELRHAMGCVSHNVHYSILVPCDRNTQESRALWESESEGGHWPYFEPTKQSTRRQKMEICPVAPDEWFPYQDQSPLGRLYWKCRQIPRPCPMETKSEVRGGDEKSTSQHTGPWNSCVCELERERGASTLQKILCHFQL